MVELRLNSGSFGEFWDGMICGKITNLFELTYSKSF